MAADDRSRCFWTTRDVRPRWFWVGDVEHVQPEAHTLFDEVTLRTATAVETVPADVRCLGIARAMRTHTGPAEIPFDGLGLPPPEPWLATSVTFGTLDAIAYGERIAVPMDSDGLRRGHRTVWVPLDDRDCVALASDVEGIARAEALAHELRDRLAPWGEASQACVIWRVADDPALALHDAMFGAPIERALLATLGAQGRALVADRTRTPSPWGARRGHWQALSTLLREAAARGLDVPEGVVPRGRAWASIADPFAPALEIFALGYALEGFWDAMPVLVCPAASR